MRAPRPTGYSDVAVIIPCFNEAQTIGGMVTQLQQTLPGAQVVVCDNNSRDTTAVAAAKAGAVVLHEPRQGKGHAVARLLAAVKAEYYVMLDGDATYDIPSLPHMLNTMRTERLGMLVGARVAQQRAAYRFAHSFGNWAFTFMLALLFGAKFTDVLSGMRIFSRAFVQSFPPHAGGFTIESALTIHALQIGVATAEVPVPYHARPAGSVSKLCTWRDGLRIACYIAGLFVTERPLLVFGGLAVGLLAAAGLAFAPLLQTYLATGLVPRMPTLVVVACLVMASVTLAVAGVLLQAMVQIRVEAKKLAYLGARGKGSMLVTWGLVVLVLLALAGLGRWVGVARYWGETVWVGWGVFVLGMTTAVVLFPAGGLVAPLVALGTVGALGWVNRPPPQHACWLALALAGLALPLVWAWGHNQVFMWDDFSHRLPSLQYVWLFDSLPRPDLPPSLSGFPAYPYGLTWLGLAVSLLQGAYQALAIALLNGAFAVVAAAMVAQAWQGRVGVRGLAIALVLLVTFSPVVSHEILASAYQDMPLALAVLAVFLAARPWLQSGAVPNPRAMLRLGFMLALVVGLKQVGLVLALLLATPLLAWWGWQLRGQLWPAFALRAGLLMAPPLAVWLLWRYYVATQIGGGEFAFMPFANWNWPMLPQMAASLGEFMIEKPQLALLLPLVSWLALRPQPLAQRLPMMWVALVGWGYAGFMGLTYLGSFGDYEAGKLASLGRYLLPFSVLAWGALVLHWQVPAQQWLARRMANPWQRYGVLSALCAALLWPLVQPRHWVGEPAAEARQMMAVARVLPSMVAPYQGLVVQLVDRDGSGLRQHVLRYTLGYAYSITVHPTPAPAAVLEASRAGVTLRLCAASGCGLPVQLNLQPNPLVP